jgi:hypothetical protein
MTIGLHTHTLHFINMVMLFEFSSKLIFPSSGLLGSLDPSEFSTEKAFVYEVSRCSGAVSTIFQKQILFISMILFVTII